MKETKVAKVVEKNVGEEAPSEGGQPKDDDSKNNPISKILEYKTLIFTVLGIITILSVSYAIWTVFRWAFPINGSGNVQTENRNVEGFDEISMEWTGKIIIEKGAEESLSIEAEDNLLPYIVSEVRGDRLIIKNKSFTRRIKSTKPIIYRVVVTDIKKIAISGSGEIEGESINSEKLEIKISGDGDVRLKDVNFEKLITKTSGSGQFNITGTADTHNIEINGSGVNNVQELKTKVCDVEINGSGDVKVNVTEKLKITINGSGRVYYKGTPSDLKQKINGSGEVEQLE